MTTLSVVPKNSWDRQSEETDASWSAFVYFRDLGPEARSVGAIARDLGHSTASCHKWSLKFNWRDRVAAWDLHCDQLYQQAHENEVKLMAERHARLAVSMQALGEQRIQQFSADPLLQAELTARDAIALVDTGVKIEREARSADKEKAVQDGGITFNFNFAPPSWAPQNLKREPPTIPCQLVDGPDADSNT